MSSTADFLEAWAKEEREREAGSKKSGGDSGYVPVPDGPCTAVLKSVTGRTSDKGESILFNYYFPAQNTDETEYVNLTPKSVKAVKAKLFYLGLDAPAKPSLDSLVDEFKKAEGFVLEVEKKSTRSTNDTKKWYRDYYIKKVLDRSGAGAAVKKTADFDDGSLPF